MFKHSFLKITALILIISCIFVLSACGSKTDNESGSGTASTTEETGEATGTEAPAETNITIDTDKPEPDKPGNGIIKKILGQSDARGIATIQIILGNEAAPKGTIELTYKGEKGSPQENSVVCVFRIEYEKDTNGKYEIKTFYNGDTYQNLHQKDEVNVVNTFGAQLRAESAVITYQPENGEKSEIRTVTADYFR